MSWIIDDCDLNITLAIVTWLLGLESLLLGKIQWQLWLDCVFDYGQMLLECDFDHGQLWLEIDFDYGQLWLEHAFDYGQM